MQKISIIIPFQKENDYLKETIFHLGNLAYRNFEVILLPDYEIDQNYKQTYLHINYPITIIPTGKVSPAIKRDIGAEKCTGELLAFIDEDAFPESNWFDIILPCFDDKSVCAVGGPQITPPKDSFWQQVSGAAFLTVLNGQTVKRYWPEKKVSQTDDWPSVNLIIKKEDFLKVGGFDSAYWPGEDTKLCYDLVQKLGKKIIYNPNAIVYHHRRSGLKKHLKQVGNYGLHRGYFAKKYPETSLKAMYIIPALFFLFATAGWASLFIHKTIATLYLSLWGIYGLAILISTISIFSKIKSLKISIATIPYIFGTHFFYGYRFLKGFFFVNELKSKLGR